MLDPSPSRHTPRPRGRDAASRGRRLLGVTLGVVMSTRLGACGDAAAPRSERQPAAAPPRAARIVSATLLSDELLWAFGDEVRARVIAVSALSEDRRWSTIAGTWSPALPRVSGTAEAILALDPDTVVLADFTADETKAALRGAGVTVIELSHLAGLDDLRRVAQQLGDAVDAEGAAARLAAEWTTRAHELRGRCPDVRVTVWSEGFVAGLDTTFADVCERLGLVDVAAAEGITGHVKVPTESIVAWTPEWFVIPCSPEDEAQGCAPARAAFAAKPGLSELDAVQRGRVLAVPSRILDTTGPALFELADHLAASCAEVR
jgi:iron complex transport system substrate-binding protein